MAAAIDAEKRPAFQDLLLKTDLFAATSRGPEVAGPRDLKAGEELPLLTVPAPNERMVAAIFTSEPRIIEAFGPGTPFIKLPGEGLLEIVAGTGAFLNPGSAYRVHWDAAGIAALLGRPLTRVITKPTNILLGTPSTPPMELIAHLRAVLGSHPGVQEAWFAVAKWPENGESSWYLDVRTHLPRTEVSEMLAEVFKKGPYAGLPLDMIVREPGEPNGIGMRIAPAVTN